jgi:hypothetical protein
MRVLEAKIRIKVAKSKDADFFLNEKTKTMGKNNPLRAMQ